MVLTLFYVDSSNVDSSVSEDSSNVDSSSSMDSSYVTNATGNLGSSSEDSSANEDSSSEDSSNEDSSDGKKQKYEELAERIIIFCELEYKSVLEIANAVSKSERHLKNRILPRMIKEEKLIKLHSDNHPNQKYIAKK